MYSIICTQQVRDSTHDGCHALQRFAKFNHDSCHGSQQVALSIMQVILLQHGCCTFVIILFGPFSRLFINLTMCIRVLFPKPTTTLGLVEQAFWRVPLFTERIGASSFEVILAWPSRHSTTGTFSFGTLGSRRISNILLHEKNSETDSTVSFLHAYSYRAGNYNCLL